MSRIATFTTNQNIIDAALGRQNDIATGQLQVSSGIKSQQYQGYNADVSALVSTKAYDARTQTYIKTNNELSDQLSENDAYISQAVDTARSFRDTIFGAIGQQDGTGLRANIDSQFQSIASALNGQFNGQYLFAGSRTSSKPIAVATLNDLAALPNSDAAFTNDTIKSTTRIADDTNLTHGILASDAASGIFAVFRDIARYDTSGNGPLSGKLTAAQQSFLEDKLAQLDTAIQASQAQQSLNGIDQKRVEDVNITQSARKVSAEKLVGDIENVNAAEAISKLTLDSTALQASFQIIAGASKLSLTNFL